MIQSLIRLASVVDHTAATALVLLIAWSMLASYRRDRLTRKFALPGDVMASDVIGTAMLVLFLAVMLTAIWL